MIGKDKVKTRYLPEMPLMLSIGVIRAMVVFPQSHHYPPQRGGTLVTAGRRPADIQSSTINHQPSIINPIAIANTPPQRLLNESSSLLIACDGSPKKSYCKFTAKNAWLSVFPYTRIFRSLNSCESRMQCQNLHSFEHCWGASTNRGLQNRKTCIWLFTEG